MMNLTCSLLPKRLPHCVLFRNLEKFPDDTVIWAVGGNYLLCLFIRKNEFTTEDVAFQMIVLHLRPHGIKSVQNHLSFLGPEKPLPSNVEPR